MANFLTKARLSLAKSKTKLRRMKGEGKRAIIFEFVQFLIIITILGGSAYALFLGSKSFQDSIFEKRKIIASIDKRLDAERELREDFDRTRDVMGRMEELFPSDDDLLKFLGEVDAIADSIGVFITTELGEKKDDGGTNSLNFTVTSDLDLDNLIKVIEKLEDMTYIIGVDSFEMISPEGINVSSGKAKVNAKLFMK